MTQIFKRLKSWMPNSDEIGPNTAREITASFHQLYYNSKSRTWANTSWMGVRTLKCPLDLWVYQEMIHDLKPDLIIETGTAAGGSALYLATCLDLIGKGKIISIDIEHRDGRPTHPRIKYILGSSTEKSVTEQVTQAAAGKNSVIVILDSDHSEQHVLNELRFYSKLVNVGSYVVVEDTNVNGHPVKPDFGPGPMEAIEKFLKENGSFEIDLSKEKYFMTFNPNGFLRRVE